MDDLDRRLIAELRADGRASLSELAKRLGVSRGTVQNRLDRLIDSEVILGFTVRLKSVADDDRIRAIMMIEVAGKSTRRVVQVLRGLPEIHALYSTNGAYDLIAEIEVANLAEFDRVLSTVRSIEGVARSETSLLLAPA
ncbi:Lrp/AsnC family transcriptional regulator [Methylocystis sp. MJC1]|jgi:DNA-binding Lrp family transcriptional regulator|uniref:Lrp/AsnC family transcriptional regulator n=1 Tax=Methylocystis sp. MJC1 TaxID=2654282 RepID=UPI0013ED14E2|nr:Lrp/AsnC family transcriptional regulator [Methylocystis sp. MJC1]KAF2989707.1 Regulatory protein AsnC [Methylocystis sp. MJC1]MBU6525585.1 Lrp/AsnC family transcriptional regulator [Methylocystis sp. MJC1]UZX12063.1 Lrp/AsnC family transcriptional regulator [Methylocystis sp. MJC1]